MSDLMSFSTKLDALTNRIEQLGQSLTARFLAAKESGATAAELVVLYRDVRGATDGIEEAGKQLRGLKEQMKSKALPEAFEREGVKTLTMDDGGRVTISQRVVASIPADTKSLAYEWLRKNQHESLIVETVNASTLGAFARTQMEAGFDLPEELFKVNILNEASLTKGKKK
jgi:hypothetical protein